MKLTAPPFIFLLIRSVVAPLRPVLGWMGRLTTQGLVEHSVYPLVLLLVRCLIVTHRPVTGRMGKPIRISVE